VHFLQRVQQRRSHSGQPVGPGVPGRHSQLPVDPADQVAASHVANEQVQGIRRLVQPTVAQPMVGQWAARQVVGLGAGVPGLVVPAVVKMPVAFELRATWLSTQVGCNHLPGGLAVALDIMEGDLVGDALIAERRDKPIEQRGRIPGANGRMNALGCQRFPGVIDIRARASDAANP
jgi:hypothetical protein